jgi:hypothetical protein
MSMRNELAFPSQPLGQGGIPIAQMADGLTKRELLAAMAMQGLLAGSGDTLLAPAWVASEAVGYADELLKKLAK